MSFEEKFRENIKSAYNAYKGGYISKDQYESNVKLNKDNYQKSVSAAQTSPTGYPKAATQQSGSSVYNNLKNMPITVPKESNGAYTGNNTYSSLSKNTGADKGSEDMLKYSPYKKNVNNMPEITEELEKKRIAKAANKNSFEEVDTQTVNKLARLTEKTPDEYYLSDNDEEFEKRYKELFGAKTDFSISNFENNYDMFNNIEKEAATQKAQDFFNKNGFTDREGIQLQPDGKRGPKTEQAYRAYKKYMGYKEPESKPTNHALRFVRDPNNPSNIIPADDYGYPTNDYRPTILEDRNNLNVGYSNIFKRASTNSSSVNYKNNLMLVLGNKYRTKDLNNIEKNGNIIDKSPLAYSIYQLLICKIGYKTTSHNPQNRRKAAAKGKFCKAIIANSCLLSDDSNPYKSIIENALYDESNYDKDSINTWLDILDEILSDTSLMYDISFQDMNRNITVGLVKRCINELNNDNPQFRNYGLLNPKDDVYAQNKEYAPIYYYPETGRLVIENLPMDTSNFDSGRTASEEDKWQKAIGSIKK